MCSGELGCAQLGFGLVVERMLRAGAAESWANARMFRLRFGLFFFYSGV